MGRPSIDPELMIRMLLYTGVRRSDVVRPGPQHARNGWLRFKVHKNRNRHPIEVEIPILPDLQRIPDARTTGNLAYLVSAYGKPYSEAGFGMRFRKWCDRGELPIAPRTVCARPVPRLPPKTAPPRINSWHFGWQTSAMPLLLRAKE